jgi:predicted DNA-binding WGR domain protein
MRWTTERAPVKSPGMSEPPGPRFFRRIDPARNMARFYVVMLQPTLFGEMAVVRQWGRIGTRGREKTEYFRGDAEAISAATRLAERKMRRGYADLRD